MLVCATFLLIAFGERMAHKICRLNFLLETIHLQGLEIVHSLHK